MLWYVFDGQKKIGVTIFLIGHVFVAAQSK